MIVSDTYIGNTRILINDEYVIHDPERVREIMQRVGRAAANRPHKPAEDQERRTTDAPEAAAND